MKINREYLREIWQYREICYFFVWRDVKVRYKQTVLGALWAVLQPFCTMVVFTLFFGKIAKMPSDGIPYPVFSYAALVPWTYFSGALSNSANSLVGNSHLMTKIYFPRVAVPASSAIVGLIDFAIASVILVGLLLYFDMPLSWGLLAWPLLVVPLLFLAMGIGLILASLNVKYRDIKYVIPFGIQLLLYATPIIYPASLIPERYRIYFLLNPLSGFIEAFRAVVLPSRDFPLVAFLTSLAVTIVIFAVGFVYFRKTEKYFADII